MGAFILNAVAVYGLPVAGVVLFVGSLGVPFPSTIIVIMLGAFVRENILDVVSVSFWALVSSVAGDMVVFGLGSWGRSWIPHRIQRSAAWMSMEGAFSRHAGLAIYLTRWILTPLAFPASLIAGNSKYSFVKFFIIDTLGEATWILLFGGLGYLFSSQTELVGDIFSSVIGLVTGLFILILGAFAVFKFSAFRERLVHHS